LIQEQASLATLIQKSILPNSILACDLPRTDFCNMG
jgi:hypothetical protein